ncbi:MAG: DUF1186 domain-containing protein [Microcystaceae cyanobacterium]
MEIPTILNELSFYTPKFPRRALQEAIKQHQEVIPLLLETLKGWLEGDVKDLAGEDYYLHLYTFFLMAQFREKQAYPLMIDFVIEAEEKAYDLFGESLTEELPRLFASVYDGDFEPLERLIFAPQGDEYARTAGLTTLVILYTQNIISREEILERFEYLFKKSFDEPENNFLLTYLVDESVNICATELTDYINQAFDQELVDLVYVNREQAKELLETHTVEEVLSELKEQPIQAFVKDAIAEMEWWACFKDQTEIEKEEIKTLEKFLIKPHHKSENQEEPVRTVSTLNTAKKKAKQKQQKDSRKKNRSKKK